jgi:hypothetical protein
MAISSSLSRRRGLTGAAAPVFLSLAVAALAVATFAISAAAQTAPAPARGAPSSAAPPPANDEAPPEVQAVPEPPPAIGFADDTLERAVRVIPDVESREEKVIDGKRTIHVKTKSGAEYLLTEDDGVTVTTVLQPETQRFRVPTWILLEW